MKSSIVDDVVFSRAVWLSGAVAVGSGAVYLLYQQHVLLRHQRYLSSQNAILTQKVLKLENDLQNLKATLVSSVHSSEELEDIFVDASDVTEDLQPVVSASSSSTADSENEPMKTIKKTDALMDSGVPGNLRTAYEILSLLANKYPDNCDVQWRLGRSAYLLASDELLQLNEDLQDDQKNLIEMANVHCEKAVKLNPESGDAHKWLAIIVGSAYQYLPLQEQVKNAYRIKEHIMKAVKYKPHDALAFHMLGRWCYSVYMLSWVERRLAAALFGEPPSATIDEALECFVKAEELSPKSSIDNTLYLAKSLIEKKDYKKALVWLRSGSLMSASSSDDHKALKEIQDLLSQYSTYDS